MAVKAKNTSKSTKTTKSVEPQKSTPNNKQSISSTVSSSKDTNMSKKATGVALIVIFAVLLFLIAYLFKGALVAADVNGEPISRLVVVKSLEKQSGSMVLENLITKTLITQEAKNRNIIITQKDIDSEIKSISDSLKKQGTTLEKAMAAQGLSQQDLADEIKVQLELRKMTEGDAKVSDKEVEEFVTNNKAQFPEGTTDDQMKSMALEQLKQQKSAERTQTLISELQKRARIQRFVNY